ncbi:Urocanate hydratase [Portunus trituberculatus]|uniref:Urocanate hydratase n=1 Tax=Portunus trituberculatus TaxID=210409 RepID=A0A5B7DKU5_PORTR|nr:Urocanate hydratase [Portunus trituberculatus]
MEASRSKITLKELCDGLPVSPLPSPRTRDPSIAHAPVRTHSLTPKQKEVREIHSNQCQEYGLACKGPGGMVESGRVGHLR